VNGAVVVFADMFLTTTFNNSRNHCHGTATTSKWVRLQVTVQNPNPGSAASNALTSRFDAGQPGRRCCRARFSAS